MAKRKEKDKRPNNYLQNITHKAKDRITQTHLRPGGGGLRYSGGLSNSCFTSGARRFTLVTHPVHEERTGKCSRQVHIRGHL